MITKAEFKKFFKGFPDYAFLKFKERNLDKIFKIINFINSIIKNLKDFGTLEKENINKEKQCSICGTDLNFDYRLIWKYILECSICGMCYEIHVK